MSKSASQYTVDCPYLGNHDCYTGCARSGIRCENLSKEICKTLELPCVVDLLSLLQSLLVVKQRFLSSRAFRHFANFHLDFGRNDGLHIVMRYWILTVLGSDDTTNTSNNNPGRLVAFGRQTNVASFGFYLYKPQLRDFKLFSVPTSCSETLIYFCRLSHK